MPEQALYLKWRPTRFEDIIGQEHITRTLQGALRQDRIRHAYLFSGPRGTGKTTTARLLAKAVNCEQEDPGRRPCNTCHHCLAVNEGRYLDLIEIDAASHTGVDDVRDLRDKIAFSPGEGRYKVYIIDEVHRFSGAAFDALLKTLEEPPDHAIFVLATTELEKVPETILSRCLPFEFRRVTLADLTGHLQRIADAEGFQIDRAALELIARQATGSVRDSISLLDQVVADPGQRVTLEIAEQALGAAGRRAVIALADAALEGNIPVGLDVIHAVVDGGADPRQFARQVVEHLRKVLLTQAAGAAVIEDTEEARQHYARQAGLAGRRTLLYLIRTFHDAALDKESDWQPQLPLELALLESLTPPQETVIIQQAIRQAAPSTTPAAEPPEPEPEAAPPGTPPVIGLLTVRDKWTDIQKAAYRLNKNLPPLLDHVQVREVSGNTLVLVAKNPIFKEKLEAEDRRRELLKALRQVLEVPLQVRIEVPGPDDAPSSLNSSDRLAGDELLAYSVHQLGGEIAEIRSSQFEHDPQEEYDDE